MNYRECAPDARLAPAIDCIWTLEGERGANGDEAAQPVLPDGRAELIVHFGDPFERLVAHAGSSLDGRRAGAGAATRQPFLIFAGQLTERLLLRPTGRVAVLGIRFRPDGAAGLMGVPQHELAGLTIGVDEVSAPIARMLADVRDSTDSPTEAVRLVQDRLVRRLHAIEIDARVRHVVESIRCRHGCISVDALAAHVGVTRRHLERRFQDLVGISPKRLARIARFQRALTLLDRADPARPGTVTAIACGYADQPHFIRDFRDLAGCPPGEHLLRSAELTGFFVERNRRPPERQG